MSTMQKLEQSKGYHTEDESDLFILKTLTLSEKIPNWEFVLLRIFPSLN